MKYLILLVALLISVLPHEVAAEILDVKERVTAEDIEEVDIEMDLAVGKYSISAAGSEAGLIAIVSGTYEATKFDYTLDFRDRNGRGDLYFSTETLRRHLDDWDEWDNDYQFKLSPDMPLNLTLDVEAAESHFDFTDLALAELDIDIGAADVEIRFPTRNKVELDRFLIDAGACDLDIYQMGNSRFREVEFDGGVGSFTLDFTGEFDYRATADVSVGLGSIHIILPQGIGVRLELDDSWLSSVDFPRREFERIRDDIYETDNFDTADGRLTIYLELGLGSAEIEFK